MQAAHLWSLLEQALLLDRRNAAHNGNCPDATNLAHTLQVLTDLHQSFLALTKSLS